MARRTTKEDAASGGKPRAKGRPRREAGGVGPAALVQMTCDLLDKTTPASISMATLARHANVDPALIRYYFRDRSSLLRAAAVQLTAELQAAGISDDQNQRMSSGDRITARAEAQLKFRMSHPNYHRLMLEEVARSDNEESIEYFKAQVGFGMSRYRRFVEAGVSDGSLRPVNVAFLYMAVIGLCEVFASGGPLIDALGLPPASTGKLTKEYARFICDLILNGVAA